MKGVKVYIKNKKFFYYDKFFIPLGNPLLFAKKIKADFLYIIDLNNNNENFSIFDKLTYIKPIIVETNEKFKEKLIKINAMVRIKDEIIGKSKKYKIKENVIYKDNKKYAEIFGYSDFKTDNEL